MVFYGIGWSLSLMLAPFIGGLLADPVLAYPEIMRQLPECIVEFFSAVPFLLPNLVVAISNVVALIIFLFKMEETRQKDEKRSRATTTTNASDLDIK